MLNNCTRLWRKAHSEVKMYKTPHSESTLEVPLSKKCTPLWRKAHFEVKMYKTRQFRTTFQTSDAAKLRAAVAKSTFGSQNAQNTSAADSFRSFWNLRCRKMACASNEKHLCQ